MGTPSGYRRGGLPVPVLHYQREELRLGGAGGVAADLAALGATVQVIGVIGADDPGKEVRRLLVECGAIRALGGCRRRAADHFQSPVGGSGAASPSAADDAGGF